VQAITVLSSFFPRFLTHLERFYIVFAIKQFQKISIYYFQFVFD